jgi:hypothetical protein
MARLGVIRRPETRGTPPTNYGQDWLAIFIINATLVREGGGLMSSAKADKQRLTVKALNFYTQITIILF